MNSRLRVLNVLNHKIPDRVPIDFGGHISGIHKKAYLELIRYLGIKDELNILDPVQQLAEPCEELLQRFHADIRYISINQSCEKNTNDNFTDEFGITWKLPEEYSDYMNILRHPLADLSVSEIKDYSFFDINSNKQFECIREKALAISDNGSYVLSTSIGGSIFETCSNLRGIERWFMDTKKNLSFCEALIDKILKYWIDVYAAFLKEVGDIVDIVIIGDDLAGQNGPLFSLDFYRKTLKPAQKTLIKHIKSLTKAKVCYHTCGSCFQFIPELIDIGVDILNPIQIGLKDMEPQKIKDTFGKQISLWGGAIDNRYFTADTRLEQIRLEVKKNMKIFKSAAGYIFSNTHNIQFDFSPENIKAIFDAAYEFGHY
jgi:uroporphyrinogen decarboxylase